MILLKTDGRHIWKMDLICVQVVLLRKFVAYLVTGEDIPFAVGSLYQDNSWGG